jgi:hypothetical protein
MQIIQLYTQSHNANATNADTTGAKPPVEQPANQPT